MQGITGAVIAITTIDHIFLFFFLYTGYSHTTILPTEKLEIAIGVNSPGITLMLISILLTKNTYLVRTLRFNGSYCLASGGTDSRSAGVQHGQRRPYSPNGGVER